MWKAIIFFSFVIIGCKQIEKNSISGLYYRTEKNGIKTSYDFESDTTVIFTTYLKDAGSVITKCNYNKIADTIYMVTSPEPISVHYLSYMDSFYLVGDSCIVQKSSKEKFCK